MIDPLPMVLLIISTAELKKKSSPGHLLNPRRTSPWCRLGWMALALELQILPLKFRNFQTKMILSCSGLRSYASTSLRALWCKYNQIYVFKGTFSLSDFPTTWISGILLTNPRIPTGPLRKVVGFQRQDTRFLGTESHEDIIPRKILKLGSQHFFTTQKEVRKQDQP